MNLFVSQAFKDPKHFLIVTLVVVFSICLHEFFHAWTALQFGDTTAADRGHLTLNPLKQMGPVSIVMFLILGFAWGAVPVDTYVLRARSRHAAAIVAERKRKVREAEEAEERRKADAARQQEMVERVEAIAPTPVPAPAPVPAATPAADPASVWKSLRFTIYFKTPEEFQKVRPALSELKKILIQEGISYGK